MIYQPTQSIQNSARPWSITCMLPDAQHYTVARFHNRRDAEDHLRFLQRHMPNSAFELVFDASAEQDEL